MDDRRKNNEMAEDNNRGISQQKKSYEPPKLTEYGELAEVTQVGIFDGAEVDSSYVT